MSTRAESPIAAPLTEKYIQIYCDVGVKVLTTGGTAHIPLLSIPVTLEVSASTTVGLLCPLPVAGNKSRPRPTARLKRLPRSQSSGANERTLIVGYLRT